jgi:hypothetical protein
MKLSECRIGTIVTNNNELGKQIEKGNWRHYKPFKRIGYISGLTQNCTEETIPLVKWSDELVMDSEIHHTNLSIYED